MKKPWYKKVWIGAIVVVFIAIFSSSEESPEVIQSNQGESTQDSKNDTEAKESYAIGDEVKLGGTVVVVNSVEKSTGSEWDQPKSGNEYVIVTVTIKNRGDEQISYNPYDFSMQNSQGQITDTAFTTIDSDTALSSGNLASGGVVSGTISFEQPIDDPNLVLKYQPNLFSSQEIQFHLN